MTTQAVTAEGSVGQVKSGDSPYSPSWLDTIVRAIDRLPGPSWAAYIPLTGLAFAFVALEAALSSRGLFGQDPAYFAYAIFQVLPLAVYHFLSRGSVTAWESFRPATDLDDATAARRQKELSTSPGKTRCPSLPIRSSSLSGHAGSVA